MRAGVPSRPSGTEGSRGQTWSLCKAGGCTLVPTAGALRLTLYLLLLRVANCALATPSCTEEEFRVGAECCHMCSPGHRVKEACGETTGTVCAPCSPGTYTAHLNGLDHCLLCRVCDADTGLVTRRKCSSTGNTVCGCNRGHFCVLVDGDDCGKCRPHRDCRPGQRVQETGTEWQDTACEDCLPGTFSAGGTQAVCEPWTKCSGLLEMEAKPGTNSTDVTCSSSVKVAILFVCIVTPVIVVMGYSGIRVRRSHEVIILRTHSDQNEILQTSGPCMSLRSCQTSITLVAMEETASVFPESDPQLMTVFRMQTSEHPPGLRTAPGPREPNVGPEEPLGPTLEG